MSVNAIILIVLAVIVLVVLILGFTLGWNKILPFLGTGDNIQTISSACDIACSVASKFDFCSKQREVKIDTSDFHQALKSLLRQDPDAIMIGEMRDAESIATALTAAETGHLVFSTLHTNSAAQTIDRIIDSFPAEQQGQISSQLAAVLVGIVSERLIPRVNGGRIPACEVMLANAAIRNLIREKKAYQIDLVIETSAQEGMITLNRSLAEYVKKGDISLENAELYSLNPAELRIILERS